MSNVFVFVYEVTWHSKGEACLIRYADDFVCAFEDRDEAEHYFGVLAHRLEQFGLRLAKNKSRCLPSAGKANRDKHGLTFWDSSLLGDRSGRQAAPEAPDLPKEASAFIGQLHPAVQGEPACASPRVISLAAAQAPRVLANTTGSAATERPRIVHVV